MSAISGPRDIGWSTTVQFDGASALERVGFWPVALLLAVAAGGAFLAGRVYLVSRAGHGSGAGLHRVTPILGVAMAGLLVTVQFSLPLSLGLLAAVTLARFRVPVKEPEEIALVMLVGAVAVATASVGLGFVGLLLLTGTLAALVGRHPWARAPSRGFTRLSIRCPRSNVVEVARVLEDRLRLLGYRPELRTMSARADESSLEYRVSRLLANHREELSADLTARAASARIEITDVDVTPTP
jgi:hypothetical protein